MSKMKSFNTEGVGMARALLAGAAVGVALDATALPAVWGWLAPAVAGAVQTVAYVLSPATATPPSGVAAAPRIDNPLSALPAILVGGQRGAFLLALCIIVAATNRASYLGWLYDGTWVGGRRAPARRYTATPGSSPAPPSCAASRAAGARVVSPRAARSPSASSAAKSA